MILQKNIQYLIDNNQIIKVSCPSDIQELINHEKNSLAKLKRKKKLNSTCLFLVTYDILFRYICLDLLSNGFKITDNKPHQTFIFILSSYCQKDELLSLVDLRHKIKKNILTYQEEFHQQYYEMMLKILQNYDN